MEVKPHRNSGIVLNGQGSTRHTLGDASYLDLDMMLNEQGSSCRIFSDHYIIARVQ
jgi:hypothetical protein